MNDTLRKKAAIVGYGSVKPGRYPNITAIELHALAAKRAIEDAGLKKEDVNGLLVSADADLGTVEGIACEKVCDYLGLKPNFCTTMNVGGATNAAMIEHAASAIATGIAHTVLCVTAGKFTVSIEAGFNVIKVATHVEFELPFGPFFAGLYALVAKRHIYMYGTTPEQLARVAVAARQWAQRNPEAITYGQGELSVEQVLSSRMIADPFHMLDCSIPCEGSNALIVTSPERAKASPYPPVYILGIGEYHTHGFSSQTPDFTSMGAKVSGQRAMEMAGVRIKDIDLAQIYDAFTINPLVYLEDLGFCKKGQGGPFVEEGHIDFGGDLPLNTFGGLLSYGHTGMAAGMSQIVEATSQLMGRAGERQVKEAEIALVHTYGGMMCSHITMILGRG